MRYDNGTLSEVNLSEPVREEHDWVVELRRELHQHPELGFEEEWTQKRLMKELDNLGLDYQEVAETGLVSLLEADEPGKCILVRSDIDGLPVTEKNEHDYVSLNEGKMHACGHDAHMANLLGSIRRLINDPPGRGTAKFIFQPGEEGYLGAQDMIDDGVMESPDVDAVLGYHVWQPLPIGKIGIIPGPCMAAVDKFEVTVRGSQTHAAYPQGGTDPIYIASQVISSLQSIVSRNLDPLDSAVVTVGSLHAGDAFNVIPDEAHMKGTVRTFSEEAREMIPRRFKEIVNGMCESLGGEAEIDYEQELPPTKNDPEMAEFVRGVAEDIVGPENVVEPDPSMGGEDHSLYQQIAPGCYTFLGMANEEVGSVHPHHHPKFEVDEDVLGIGVELVSRCTREWLNQN